MDVKEVISLALAAIRANKLRSILTTLGIVIGVLTIITMMTLIEGLNSHVTKELSVIGTNTFYVQKYPALAFSIEKYRNRPNITIEDAEAIEERATLVSMVSPEELKFMSTVKRGREKTNPDVFVIGSNQDWQSTNGFFVEEGRFISPVDIRYSRNICILGVDIVEELFPFEKAIGKDVNIDGYRFTVVGVFEEKGSFFGQNRDKIVLIPITTFEKIYGKERSIQIAFKSSEPELILEAMDEVTGILRAERGVPPGEPNNFEILTKETLMDTWRELTDIIFAVAVGACAISLFVGGIGVMNIMLVSVTERTREIGIRKAVGAKRKDIQLQFLAEAVLICEFGGLLGVVLGLGIGLVIGSFSPLPAAVPPWSIVLGLGFVSLIGIFFGLYPAVKAARLHPINALRFE